MIVNNILELIGKTPMLRLNNFKNKYNLKGNVIAKLENYNPMHSVKDRIALQMIEDAEKKGLVNETSTIIEATSGNTGIGLALVAAIKKYRLIITMPDSMSIERVQILRALGAEVILTPASQGMSGSIEKANQLSQEMPNSFLTKQFENESNPQAHILHTGKEIYEDTDGNVDIFVAGVGTGGTLTGTATVLKKLKPDVRIVAVEPAGSPMISQHKKGSHKIQGIGAGFIPKVLNTDFIDETITVENENAFLTAKELLTLEGLFAGISAGAAVFAANQLALRPENADKNIVVIIPDSGYRYMSNHIFE